MSTHTQIEQLESAIHKRAQVLAESHLSAAQAQREKMLAESAKRLRRREEREIEMAKAEAEQEYRRIVQASEIKMQAELDQLRWKLLQSVINHLYEHLKRLRKTTYINLLKQYFISAAQQIEDEALVVEVNHHDHALLAPQWEEIVKSVPDKQCTLSDSHQQSTGGVLVRADRIRIDNTFEGLIARLEDELYQIITAQLFASATQGNSK